jgi:type III restriction enzyme
VNESFFERPILNSPYAKPRFYHPLDEHGQPLGLSPVEGRRPSKFIVPVPAARRRRAATQGALPLETYSDSAIVNEIRGHVDAWRGLPGGADWGVTPTTQRLLEQWRSSDFAGQRPFFCQIEAIETLIWLTEVARGRRQYAHLWRSIHAANAEANPELVRLALKMATGAGKTTVMAMVIAWQTLNAVRTPNSDRFSRAFLIVTPGITIRDRLQVLYPEHPENYYRARELLPNDMLGDIAKAVIVITNYHSFQRRETLGLSRVGRAFLTGNAPNRSKVARLMGRCSMTPAASCSRSRTSSSSMTRRTTATASGRSPRRRGSTARPRPRPRRTTWRRGCGSAASRR